MVEKDLQENVAYDYVSHLRNCGAPATRASGFLEALNFAKGHVGLKHVAEITASSRIRGACEESLRTKKPVRKRDALTTRLVGILENVRALLICSGILHM